MKNENIEKLGLFIRKVYLPKKSLPVTAKQIAKEINERVVQFNRKYGTTFKNITEIVVRNAINNVRANDDLSTKEIIGVSTGYYLSDDLDDILKQIESLEGRVEAINNAIRGLRRRSKNYKRKEKSVVVNYKDKSVIQGDLFDSL